MTTSCLIFCKMCVVLYGPLTPFNKMHHGLLNFSTFKRRHKIYWTFYLANCVWFAKYLFTEQILTHKVPPSKVSFTRLYEIYIRLGQVRIVSYTIATFNSYQFLWSYIYHNGWAFHTIVYLIKCNKTYFQLNAPKGFAKWGIRWNEGIIYL